jgi:hypothetical protein
VPYILGHIIPVSSETGKSYGDLDEQYLTASYRVEGERLFAHATTVFCDEAAESAIEVSCALACGYPQ